MDVLTLQIFVSLVLVVGAIVLFAWSARQGDHDEGDRLSLLPMDDDDPHATEGRPADLDATQRSTS